MMSKKYGEVLNNDVIMEGTMKKSPPQKSKAFFNFITKFSCIYRSHRPGKKWRNRHFVLYKTFPSDQVYLLYFKVDPSLECKNIGSIDLEKLTNLSVDVGCAVNRSNVFSIQTIDQKGNNRIYYLSAQSFEIMTRWVDKIVSSLNLNNHNNSIHNSVLTLPSPAKPNISRNTSRIAPHYVSTPKLNTTMWSNNTSPEAARFRINNLIDRSKNNTISSYYNLSTMKIQAFQDNLEDPILAEDEDIYKYPCEPPNIHAYVNLNDEKNAQLVTRTNSPDTIFFAADDNITQSKQETKSLDSTHFQEYKLPENNTIVEYQNLSTIQCNNELSEEKQIQENDNYDFDFPLPTRLRNKSTSTSSSSDSSSIDDGIRYKESLPDPAYIEKLKITQIYDTNSPSVPKRLNIPEPLAMNLQSETVLPIKTPKLYPQKSDTVDFPAHINDESLSHLNYVDADNLLLKNNQRFDSGRDSTYSSLTMTTATFLNMYPSIGSTSELKCPDIKNGRETPSKCHCDDVNQSALFPGYHALVKDVLPTVEYREICDARTEALLKLSARILNNE